MLYSSMMRTVVMTSPGVWASLGLRRVMLFTTSMPPVTFPKTEWQDTPRCRAVFLGAVGVEVVQEGCLSEGDEELAAVGGEAARVGHGEDARVVVAEVGVEFALEAVARAARSGACGVAGLGHEAFEDAVECDAVVESLAGEEDEVVDDAGDLVGVEFDLELIRPSQARRRRCKSWRSL